MAMTQGNASAYPGTDAIGFVSEGLTKRELFAAMAMQGLCVQSYGAKCIDVAKSAIDVADALLAELAKEPTQ